MKMVKCLIKYMPPTSQSKRLSCSTQSTSQDNNLFQKYGYSLAYYSHPKQPITAQYSHDMTSNNQLQHSTLSFFISTPL